MCFFQESKNSTHDDSDGVGLVNALNHIENLVGSSYW